MLTYTAFGDYTRMARGLLIFFLSISLLLIAGLALRNKLFYSNNNLPFNRNPNSVVIELWRDTDAVSWIKEHRFTQKLQVFGNGKVIYTEIVLGKNRRERESIKRTKITPNELRGLLTYFERQGFFQMKDRYAKVISGAGAEHIRVNLLSSSKEVTVTSYPPDGFDKIWHKLLSLVKAQ